MKTIKYLIILLLLLSTSPLWGQERWFSYELEEKRITGFEEDSEWTAEELSGAGGIRLFTSIRKGKPYDLREGTRVLGLKIEFTDTAACEILLKPQSPLLIGKELKSISFWMQSDNSAHWITLLLTDEKGEPVTELPFGKCNWMGWKKLTASGIQYLNLKKLYLGGIKMYCNPLEIRGENSYFYFDEISVEVGKWIEHREE